MTRDSELRSRAEKVIPAGMYGHLSTKQLPANYPQFFSEGYGSRIRDVDGKEYIDYMCAFGLNLFGYGDKEINDAYVRQMQRGDVMSGAPEVMVELAEVFVDIVGHAQWAVFVKNGTDATSLGAMIARAYSGKEKLIVARGAYHGAAAWCALHETGTTAADRRNKILCDYNDVASLERAVDEAGGDLAAIFAAPLKHDAFVDQQPVDPNYARRARELCDQTGALLIVDDVRAGFRIARDCSWAPVGVEPDLSSWGKCFANGHAISALLGSDKARRAASKVYAAGSYWCQAAPMAAALVTLARIKSSDYLENINALGQQLRKGLANIAGGYGIGFRQTGPTSMPLFLFDDDPDLRKGFYWSSEMLNRGIYVHPWHNMFINNSLTPRDIELTLEAADASFKALRRELPNLGPNERLARLKT